ncbi:uncharacterized protein LOC144573642 [Carex rostrata]
MTNLPAGDIFRPFQACNLDINLSIRKLKAPAEVAIGAPKYLPVTCSCNTPKICETSSLICNGVQRLNHTSLLSMPTFCPDISEKAPIASIKTVASSFVALPNSNRSSAYSELVATTNAVTASGSALPLLTEKEDPLPAPVLTTPVAVVSTSQVTNLVANEEEKEEDDEFAQLARRKSKMKSVSTESSIISQPSPSTVPEPSTSVHSNSFSLPDPPAPVKTTSKEDDIINLLSLSIAPQSSSPLSPTTSTLTPLSTSNQNPSPITSPGNSYAVSWAPPQPQEALNKTSPPIMPPWAPPQAQPQPQPHTQRVL